MISTRMHQAEVTAQGAGQGHPATEDRDLGPSPHEKGPFHDQPGRRPECVPPGQQRVDQVLRLTDGRLEPVA